MPRQPERRHQHQIESKVEVGEVGARSEEGFSGTRASSPLPRRESCGCDVYFAPRLHLDHRKHTTAPRQDVDLARRASPTMREDAPATQPQVPQAKPFGKSPAALRLPPASRGSVRCSPHSVSPRIARARR